MAKLQATAYTKAVRADKALDALLYRLLSGKHLETFVKKVEKLALTVFPVGDFEEALTILERDCKAFPNWEELFIKNTDNALLFLTQYENSEQHSALLTERRQAAWAGIAAKKQADETVEA